MYQIVDKYLCMIGFFFYYILELALISPKFYVNIYFLVIFSCYNEL